MKAIVKNQVGIFVIFVTLMIIWAHDGHAQDQLYLTGIVRSVDSGSGIIRVDVTSEGCKGLREFRAPSDAAKDIESALMGKRMQFYIDSQTCARGRIYNILIRGRP